jgi:hypothetical protein
MEKYGKDMAGDVQNIMSHVAHDFLPEVRTRRIR